MRHGGGGGACISGVLPGGRPALRLTGSQGGPAPVGVRGGARDLPSRRGALRCEAPPCCAARPHDLSRGGGPRRSGISSGWSVGPALGGGGALAHPLAVGSGHKVVAVAVATAVPEVGALGREDVEVVAGHPAAAGAGGAGQRADGSLNCSTGSRSLQTVDVFLSFLWFVSKP